MITRRVIRAHGGICMTRLSAARIYILFLILILMNVAQAENISVVDVKRNIQMSESEPAYRDYYINAGSNQGFKKDMVVHVVRKKIVHDSTGTKSYGELELPVGELKIIFANERLSIAREQKSIDLAKSPVLDQNAIMVGDSVQAK